MGSIADLHRLGQSLWYDNIQRRLLQNGELEELIRRGEIRGVTSNPAIFNNAIAKSSDYDNALKPLAWSGWKSEDIFWQLAIEDIQAAADLFRPIYDESRGKDGYVSLEVSPLIANETEATIKAAKSLWQRVDRPNLMIKIPATRAGIPAIQKVIAAGINVNVTLIFSLERYGEVIDAYLAGLEERAKEKLDLSTIASVASFFVSRVDTKVDSLLESMIEKNTGSVKEVRSLLGKAAIANARLAYALFNQKFISKRFQRMKELGANVQRPLWASTSTKNPNYRDVIYMEELIGDQTVNTAPPATIDAFRDHGNAALTITNDLDEAEKTMASLAALGISMSQVCLELEEEGVKAFADAFHSLLNSIEERRMKARKEIGSLADNLPQIIEQHKKNDTLRKLRDHDPSLWVEDKPGQEEISRRLGWLNAPLQARQHLEELHSLLDESIRKGFKKALVLGMGGSSLAPEVFSLVFDGKRDKDHSLEVSILDSTDPDQVQEAAANFPPSETLYILSSKSGSTAEVNAFFRYFWKISEDIFGDRTGAHFIAITDPGTSLDALANKHQFMRVFHGNPEVGGRFSALTVFGLVPAVLSGVDIQTLLNRAEIMMKQSLADTPLEENPGLVLGSMLGYWAEHGKDKLTILTDPEISSFGSWLEQLIAESTGKLGKGIVPIDCEPEWQAEKYQHDRIFIYLRITGKEDGFTDELIKAGQPVIILPLVDPYDIGGEFYRWGIAVSIACSIMHINPFDQPDVQFNKSLTQKMIREYQENRILEEGQAIWQNGDQLVFGNLWDGLQDIRDLHDLVKSFLSLSGEGEYIAINAYVPRNQKNLEILTRFRQLILQYTGKATTLGFGPRFLHSTGQLHKGGANKGLFIVITQEPEKDLEIPEEKMTFGILERAQALGDIQALQERKRRVIRIHLVNSKLDDILWK